VSDRLSLLRAILVSPKDDLPRLVFADWLQEHGTTDADAARAEFIRLGCKLKSGKRPLGTNETAWLTASWNRLFPSTLGLASDYGPLQVRWQGRTLSAQIGWHDGGESATTWIYPSFARGFAQRVQFKDRRGYDRFRAAVAADEPLAVLGPRDLPPMNGRNGATTAIRPEDWGADVFDRIVGFDAVSADGGKRFRIRLGMAYTRIEDFGAGYRARTAIADAMTALAREANGLTPNPPEPA
jgi:uncharacterized protein (TIGR02996 family)